MTKTSDPLSRFPKVPFYGLLASSSTLLLATCVVGAAGPYTAASTGSTLDKEYPRLTSARPVGQCGDGSLREAGQNKLVRAPYLQQVQPRSALLLFTSKSAKPVTVDVSRPDGTHVTSTLSSKDETAPLANAHQSVVRMEGLEPNTLYCYALRGLTRPVGFVTAPEPGSGAETRFVAFGDSGDGGPGQRAVLEQISQVPFDFIAHTGDLAYTHGRLHEIEQHVFGVYAPLFRSHAFYPASGNHDYLTDQAAPFRQVFALPENGGPAGRERYYSFDWGDVHFTVLDTELVDSEQAKWLDADLSASRARWKIVYGHKPPFSSGSHGSDRRVKDVFVPIFERHRIPLVLSGHEHNYERTRPLNGVTYIVTGGGGRHARSVGRSDFTAHSVRALHFVYVAAGKDNLELHAIDASGREFDAIRIPHST